MSVAFFSLDGLRGVLHKHQRREGREAVGQVFLGEGARSFGRCGRCALRADAL